MTKADLYRIAMAVAARMFIPPFRICGPAALRVCSAPAVCANGQAQRHRSSLVIARARHAEGWSVDAGGFYGFDRFSSTAVRMCPFQDAAPELCARAVEGLELDVDLRRVTHLIVIFCTGFSAPRLDCALINRSGLDPWIRSIMVGFMGYYAAVTA